MKTFKSFIGADWSCVPARRAAWSFDVEDKNISPCTEPIVDLSSLLEWAEELPSPTLLMLDAGLGMSAGMAQANDWHLTYRNFSDLLRKNGLTFDFLNPVRRLQEWTPHQPFIHLPAGQGSFSGLKRKAEGMLFRSFEESLGAKPVFILSGIPGCVGGASRNVWVSLPALLRDKNVGLWPFDGDMEACAKDYDIVICEAYPKLALQISLASTFPCIPKKSRKRDSKWRATKLSEIFSMPWFSETGLEITDFADAIENEDSFDALLLILAALRIRPFHTDTSNDAWEGAILSQELVS